MFPVALALVAEMLLREAERGVTTFSEVSEADGWKSAGNPGRGGQVVRTAGGAGGLPLSIAD
jgi:hypothetical protein